MKKENENHRLFLLVLLAASVMMLVAPVYAEDYYGVVFPITMKSHSLADGTAYCTAVGSTLNPAKAGKYFAREWWVDNITVTDTDVNYGSALTTGAPRYYSYTQPFCTPNPGDPFDTYYTSGVIDPRRNITFDISLTGSFTSKLSGVLITLSNGQYNTTGTDGTALIRLSTHGSTYTYSLVKSGYTTKTAEPLGGYGETGGILYTTMTQQLNTSVKFDVDVVDAVTGYLIDGSTIGIRNMTANTWRNSSLPGGLAQFDSTDTPTTHPLSVGQLVQVAATKTGYVGDNRTFVIPFAGPPYHKEILSLLPTGYIPTTGNWNAIVTVKRNVDLALVPGVLINIYSGVNSVAPVCTATTDTNGKAFCSNMTYSTSAWINAIHQHYEPYTNTLTPLVNGTSYPQVQLVLKGAYYNITPVSPQPTATPYDPNKPGVYPVPTDASGQPITSAAGKGYAAFGVLIDAVYAIMQIVVGLVLIWLMWMAVYLMTGGKIIDKIMKRGRR